MKQVSHHQFDSIWGHDSAKRLVERMLEMDRLPHALMIHGSDGVGKRSLAFAAAKLILSTGLNSKISSTAGAPPAPEVSSSTPPPTEEPEDDFFGGGKDMFGEVEEEEPAVEAPSASQVHKPEPEPAPEAPQELSVSERVDDLVGRSYPLDENGVPEGGVGFVDLTVIEPLGRSKSIKVEQIRDMQESCYVRPLEGSLRVVLIFGADTITGSAANSLLKLLEEPPSYLVLILVTDHYHRVLETIRSRCASLLCHPMPKGVLKKRLIEEEGIAADVADVAASLAEGRPGKALRFVDSAVLQARRSIFDARLGIDRQGLLALPLASAKILESAGSLETATLSLLTMARDRMVRQIAPTEAQLLINSDSAAILSEVACDTLDLFDEAERLIDALRMNDHPAVPAPLPTLQVALWPEGSGT